MRITAVDVRSVRLSQPKRRSLPRTDDPTDGLPESSHVAVVQLTTDGGLTGAGWVLTRHSRVVQSIIDDCFASMIVEHDPHFNERIHSKAKQQCPDIVRGGSEAIAFAALDFAIWDIKTQMAKLPLSQFLGGKREWAPAYISETSHPGLSADQVTEIAKPLIDQGLAGLWVGVSGRDPIRDANKLQHVRDQLGEEIWFGVCGHHGFDLNTALAFGRFLEEEMDADVFADSCPADDIDAYARLAADLELTVAAGSTLGFDRFADLVMRTRVGALRVDIARMGGITPFLKIAALAEMHHRVVMPVGNVEVTSALACGLPAVVAVDYDRSTETFRSEPLLIDRGRISAPKNSHFAMNFSQN